MRFSSKMIAALFLAALLPVLASCGDTQPLVLNGSLIRATKLNDRVNGLILSKNYTKALPLAEKALALREKWFKPENPFVIESMDSLAAIYVATRRYKKAEALYNKRLTILKETSDPEHLDVAATLYKMAPAYRKQGKFTKAASFLRKARIIYEKNLGPDHAFIVQTIRRQANLYQSIGMWQQAVPLMKEARAMQARLARHQAKKSS